MLHVVFLLCVTNISMRAEKVHVDDTTATTTATTDATIVTISTFATTTTTATAHSTHTTATPTISTTHTTHSTPSTPAIFAYRQGRGTDDFVNTLVHLICKYLDKPKAYARLLFIGFSSSFYIIQPHTLLTKLKQINANPYIIKWYNYLLTYRVQLVKVNQTLSQTLVTRTGAPQGCVSSPILYILYTNDCTSSSTNNYIIKCSDDSAILSLLHVDSDISMYTSEIESCVHKLGVSKTQEMIFYVKLFGADHLPVVVHGEDIAQICQYKYLGFQGECPYSQCALQIPPAVVLSLKTECFWCR